MTKLTAACVRADVLDRLSELEAVLRRANIDSEDLARLIAKVRKVKRTWVQVVDEVGPKRTA